MGAKILKILIYGRCVIFKFLEEELFLVIILYVWWLAAKSAEVLNGSAKAAGCQVRRGEGEDLGLKGRSTAQIASPRPDGFPAVRSTCVGSEIDDADLFAPEATRGLASGRAAEANHGG